MIRPIIQHPDDRLRQVASRVPDDMPAEQLAQHVADLRETFAATGNCVGLAANQLGIPYRIVIVDMTRGRTGTVLMVNPVIDRASIDTQRVMDGCMSVKHGQPYTFRATQRPKRIEVSWLGANGVAQSGKFAGPIAAAIHHELDHLDGVLFLDRIGKKAASL